MSFCNSSKIGILLVNLGTPHSPSQKDVHRYLNEFLTDGRVITVPWLWRQILVRGFIVPKRYRQSAATYTKVWTDEGSPLLTYGRSLAQKLQDKLGDAFCVELAMRYQTPSISTALQKFEAMGLEHLVILPLFPQYASATTGSVHQKVMQEISEWEIIPSLSFINSYATNPLFLDCLAAIGSKYEMKDYDHILFSFHGLPRQHLLKADRSGTCLKQQNCCSTYGTHNRDCYRAQCYATARGIVERLKLSPDHYSITFQSRLGKEPWTEPYTEETIRKLAEKGVKKLLVFAPAFTADCLETTYEIGMEYAHLFKSLGGEKLQLVESLNDDPRWVDALQLLIEQQIPHALLVKK